VLEGLCKAVAGTPGIGPLIHPGRTTLNIRSSRLLGARPNTAAGHGHACFTWTGNSIGVNS